MKFYFRLTILIGGLLAAVGLFNQSRLQTLRLERDRLRAEAARPEVPTQRQARGAAIDLAHLDGLSTEDRLDKIDSLVSSVRNRPAQRSVLLVALRNYLGTVHDPSLAGEIRRAAFEGFARGVDPGSTESAIEWISESPADEKALFAEGLAYSSTREASGRWIEWMALNLTPEQSAQPVADLVEDWTQEDYQSAGKWLAAAAESPAKQVAVQAYVEAVAALEPHVAVQWAMTLPEGAKRDASLSAIHANWPLDDPEGKTTFQREHHME